MLGTQKVSRVVRASLSLDPCYCILDCEYSLRPFVLASMLEGVPHVSRRDMVQAFRHPNTSSLNPSMVSDQQKAFFTQVLVYESPVILLVQTCCVVKGPWLTTSFPRPGLQATTPTRGNSGWTLHQTRSHSQSGRTRIGSPLPCSMTTACRLSDQDQQKVCHYTRMACHSSPLG